MHFTTSSVPNRSVMTSEGEMLFFSGTAYLGMPPESRLHELVLEGMKIYGANYGVSRTSNMRLDIFEDSEAYLCQRIGAEAALTLSSGYMAGQLLVRRLRQLYPSAQFHYAPHTHPAVLMEGFSYPQMSFEEWKKTISAEILAQPDQEFILVADTVNTLYGQKHDFEWLGELNRKIILVIDDSHSFGVLGENGNGIFEMLPPLPNVELIVVSSLSKASGIPAGFVLCSSQLKNELMESGFFRGSSPANPAYLYAFMRLEDVYREKHQNIQRNITYFAQKIKDLGIFQFTENYPVFYTKHNQLYEFLLKRKIFISSFAYPRSDGDIITRVILSSLHTQEDLDKLADAIDEYYKSL